jgi:hypothetical protein
MVVHSLGRNVGNVTAIRISDPCENAMQNEKLVSRMIGMLEHIHTLALLLLVFGWELYHFYLLLIQKR